MNIFKKIVINIFNTIRIFLTNLRRNFLRELLVGIGVVIGVAILIIATTFGDGFEKLVKNSILGQVRYEQLKIKSTGNETLITIDHIKELEKIEGVVRAVPASDISYPISAILKIPVINRRTLLGLVGNAIPSELADPYIEDDLKDRFPNGFHKTNGITPVMFSNFVYEALEDFMDAEGLSSIDLRNLIRSGYEFKLRMGKSMFNFSSVDDTIELQDGTKINTDIIDEFMNDILNNPTKYNTEYNIPKAMFYKAGSQVGSSDKQDKSSDDDFIDVKSGSNPYEYEDHKAIINENRIENCMFVGYAPIHLSFTLSIPLEILQAYKKEIDGDKFKEGYTTAFINIENKNMIEAVMDDINKFNDKHNFKIDEQYETMRGISKVVKDTVTALRALVIGLGSLILLLSAISIFYSFMYIISRREKEIGLYRFFGATRGKVIFMLVLESAFIGFICSFAAYLFSHWIITDFLPSNFDIILENVSENFLNMIFSTGSDFSKEITFSSIFRFDYPRSIFFMWVGVIVSAISSLIPAVKGSYSSLFKTINS